MGRIVPVMEGQLTDNQAGFHPGHSCCGQDVNLTPYTEDGFETCKIIEAVFVDLLAAYNTMNHCALLLKLARILTNSMLVSSLLKN